MRKRWLKLLLLLVVLTAAAVGLILWNIDPILESLRPEIQKVITENLGRPVSFGKLSLRLFPSAAVEISDLRLEGSSGSSGVKTLSLKTHLVPLLSRRLEVEEAGIDGLDVQLTKQADGTIAINGTPLGSKEKKPGANAAAPEADNKSSVTFDVKNAWIKSSHVVFTDETIQPKQSVSIENISGEFHDITSAGISDFRIAAKLLGKAESNILLTGDTKFGENAGWHLKAAWNDFDLAEVAKLLRARNIKLDSVNLSDTATITATLGAAADGISIDAQLTAGPALIGYGTVFNKDKNIPFVVTIKGKNSLPALLSGKLAFDSAHVKLGELEFDTPMAIEPGKQTKVGLKTTHFPLAELGKFVPLVQPYTLKGDLISDASVTIPAGGSAQFSGGVDLKNVSAVIPGDEKNEGKDGKPITDINGHIGLTNDVIEFKSFTLVVSGQKVEWNGKVISPAHPKIEIAAKAQDFLGGSVAAQANVSEDKVVGLDVKGTALDLTKVSEFANPGSKVSLTGTLSSLSFKATGPQASFADQMNGTVTADAAKGTIEGVNILGQTLGQITQIPGIGGALSAYIPEKDRPLLESKSSPFDRLTLDAQLHGKNVQISNFSLEHSLYSVTGQGEIEAGGNMKFTTQLHLAEALTGDMVKKESKLKLLLDKTNSIVLPVVITRKNGVFLVLPDITNLGTRALGNTVKDSATKALDKVSPGLGKTLDSLFR